MNSIIRKIRQKLRADGFFRALAPLISGSAFAQLITIVVSPITTRLFSPAEIGVYTLITSAPSMFGAILSLRYDMPIIYDRDEKNVYPLLFLSMALVIVSSFFIACGYYFYYKFVGRIAFNPIVASVYTFFQCVLFGIINVLNSWNNRSKEYELMADANVKRTLVQNVGTVGAGLLGLGTNGLLISQTLGYLAGVKKQSKTLRNHIRSLRQVTYKDLKNVAKVHHAQATLSAPASFANGFSYTVISYFIQNLFNTTIVGYYSMSFRMLGMPINIVSSNISRVFAEKAAKEKSEHGTFLHLFNKTLLLMVFMGLPILLLFIFTAPSLFRLIFGSGWEAAGVYVQILIPMFTLRFICGSLSASTMISGQQLWDLFVQILLAISVIISYFATVILSLRIELFLTLISLLFSLVYLIYIYIFWRCAH